MRHEWDWMPGESDDVARTRRAADMSAAMEGASSEDILGEAVALHGKRLAMVSSFGAESVVLLHLLSRVDPNVPVLFLDTEMLFPETLAYQADVAETLGLKDVRRLSADETVLRLADPSGTLHKAQPDDCCRLRKTLPLEGALVGFEASVTGRKRHQTADRAAMKLVEIDHAGRFRYNPLASWTVADMADHMDRYDLPRHPLVAHGYASIGCAPCTTPVKPGEDPRSGRWRGTEKSECGIHFGPDGKIVRTAA